jgi:hypothetical protein
MLRLNDIPELAPNLYYFKERILFMNWLSFSVRGVLIVVLVCGLLYWANATIPMGALLVFLLALSITITWAIVNILKDDDILANLFDD